MSYLLEIVDIILGRNSEDGGEEKVKKDEERDVLHI